LPQPVKCRKGSLSDLKSLKIDNRISIAAESLEFNVLGMGHEFWVAEHSGMIIGISVLARENDHSFRILHLEVAASQRKKGVGRSLLQAISRGYPQCDFAVVPSKDTEGFYEHMGFLHVGRWEMKRQTSSSVG